MLEKLALKHSLWLNMAKGICKDAYLADDVVSEMYLKLSDCDKELNDYYIYFTIKHIFINWIREEKKRNEVEFIGIELYYESSEKIEIDLPDNLSWVEKQILLLRQEKSCREIERIYKIPYLKVYRTELKAKEKIKGWAEEKYKELATS